MPAIAHLQPREDSFFNPGTSHNLPASLGLIIGVGLIPALIVLWVCIWLMVTYPLGRNCCCIKRKRRVDDKMETGEATVLSQETLHEKEVHDVPDRPYAAYTRAESGSSSRGGRLTKPDDRPAVSKTQTRASMQSIASASTVQEVREPKRFV